MPYPTTIILLAVIACVTALGWNGTLDGQAVAGTLSGVIAAVTVGHYTKTTAAATAANGSTPAPGTVTTSTSTTTTPTSAELEKDVL